MTKRKRTGFWGKFDELMDSMPGLDDDMFAGDNEVHVNGRSNNVVVNGNSKIKQSSSFSSSTSSIVQGGKKIVIKTKNGKTTITVNGKEYVPKGENK